MQLVRITTSQGSIRGEVLYGPGVYAVYGDVPPIDGAPSGNDDLLLGVVGSEVEALKFAQGNPDQEVTWEGFRIVGDVDLEDLGDVYVTVANYLYDTPDGRNPDIRGVFSHYEEARRWFMLDPDLSIWKIPFGKMDISGNGWVDLTTGEDLKYRESFRASHPIPKSQPLPPDFPPLSG
jgi:hypothetical protein